jgi:hypothetical protein
MGQAIYNIFDHPFFIIVGGLFTLVAVVLFIYNIFLVIKGIFPIWYRLGLALSKRKIAIFADEEFDDLKNLLIDSKIFQKNNIRKISRGSIKKAQEFTLLLVHWKSYKDQLDEILTIKKDSAALIIYAPLDEGKLNDDIIGNINTHRNSIIVNMRGRLLNDILISMITTIYEKR